MLSKKEKWVNFGYYPFIRANMPANSILDVEDANEKVLMNNDYYIFRGHGNAGGAAYYNGLSGNGGWVDLNNMPNLNGTKLVLWADCYGAKTSYNHNQTGVTSSLARHAVIKGAQYGLGWTESILTQSATIWTEHFIDEITSGKTVLQSSKLATDKTRSDEWWVIFWGNDEITRPIVYERVSPNQIVWYQSWNENPVAYSDNVNPDGSSYEEPRIGGNNNVLSFNNYHVQVVNGQRKQYLMINNTPTNIPYTTVAINSFNQYNEISKELIELSPKKGEKIYKGIFLANGAYRNIATIICSDGVTTKHIDLESGLDISHKEFIEISKLR